MKPKKEQVVVYLFTMPGAPVAQSVSAQYLYNAVQTG